MGRLLAWQHLQHPSCRTVRRQGLECRSDEFFIPREAEGCVFVGLVL